MDFKEILRAFGFKKLPNSKARPGVLSYSYSGTPTLFADIFTDEQQPYMWITGNREKDARGFPGGKIIGTPEELNAYLFN